MNRLKRYLCLLLPAVLACMLVACSGNDDYHYPPVKLEYLTAYSDADGRLQAVRTDDGTLLPIVERTSNQTITPDSLVRIVTNYEPMQTADGAQGIKLYGWSAAIAPLPMTGEVEHDDAHVPAEVLSAWMGYEYLNILLGVKQQGVHTYGFIEESLSTDVDAERAEVSFLLYHKTESEVDDYTKRSYLSIPLWPYLNEEVRSLTVHFALYTASGELRRYTFDYNPND